MIKNGIILGVLFIAVFIAGFYMGRFTSFSVGSFASPTASTQSTTQQNTSPSVTSSTSATTQTTPATVPTSSLTEGQKSMLRAMGIDPNNFTITPAMVACAEAKLGAARVGEIKNGATPSFTEGIALAACYRQ